MKITDRGAWLSNGEGHMFDASLAEAIAEYLIDQRISSVIDIGCGNGAYTRYLLSCGIDCQGYDGNPNTPAITNRLCHVADFSEPQDLGRFDCVLSLEVGEHIPWFYEPAFLDNLANHASKLVILSWAVVGQGGFGHCNERDNNYIRERMVERGFTYDAKASDYLRSKASTCPWFRDTLMIFRRIYATR